MVVVHDGLDRREDKTLDYRTPTEWSQQDQGGVP